MKTTTKQLWIALLLIVAGLQISIAQTLDPQPPRNLSATVSTSPNGGSILLKWQSSGVKPDGFNIFSAFNDVQGTVVFKIAGSFLAQNDSSGWYFYTLPVYTSGTYSIYVTAFGNMKESDPSNVVRVDYKAKDLPPTTFQFQSIGSWLAAINELYTYDANVKMRTSTNTLVDVPEDGKSVMYSLAKEPQGMTIDAQTGKVSWMPTMYGEYYVYVMASIQFQGTQATISQAIQISVRKCPQLTTISGVVNDESGAPIKKGFVIITNTQASDSLNRYPVYTAAIKSGYYTINVDEGTFTLQAGGGDFEGEWYKDSPTQDKSTPVTIMCGDTTLMANFIVKRIAAPQLYTVRGIVTDKVTGQPIPKAIIEFTNAKNSRPNTSQYTATTDAKGDYTVQLPGDQLFVARCTDEGFFDPTTANWIVQYLPQYYNEVSLLTEATIINPSDKIAGYNFRLVRKPDAQFKGHIRGTLTASDGHVLVGKVMAFPVKDTRGEVLTTDVLIDGTYSFTNVATGNYVLFAVATQEAYVPGFYRAGRTATLSWGEATVISVGMQADSPSYAITLDPLSAIKGKGRIRGTIGKGKGIVKSGTPLAADPLSGAMVYAIDANGKVCAYSWSDGNGAFETSELLKGKYTLVASKIGYKEYTAEVEIADEDTPMETVVELSVSGASGVEEGTLVNSAVVFPNPATDNITVEFTGEGATTVQVMSTLGGEVLSGKITSNGLTRYTFSSESLSSGSYFVKISTGNRMIVLPVSVIK